jgi:hypothetical protein
LAVGNSDKGGEIRVVRIVDFEIVDLALIGDAVGAPQWDEEVRA